jgi:hypothetical protein
LKVFYGCLYYAALRPSEAVMLRELNLYLPARLPPNVKPETGLAGRCRFSPNLAGKYVCACQTAVRMLAGPSRIAQCALHVMQKASPPPLLPLLRSRLQAEILTLVLLGPEEEWSLTGLATRTGASVSSVQREITRAEQRSPVTLVGDPGNGLRISAQSRRSRSSAVHA